MQTALNGPDMVLRIRKLEIALLALTLALALFAGVQAVAQTQTDRSEIRDIRHVEHQVEDLSKAHTDLKFDIEKRLTKIETYVTAGAWLLGVIGALLFGQLGKNLLDLIAVRRGTQSIDEGRRKIPGR